MAKFTEEEIKSFNEYQLSGIFHPFTCGSERRTDKDHLDGEGLLVLDEGGLECPYCEYRQDWAHGFMLDDSWRKTAKTMMSGGWIIPANNERNK